MDDTPSKKYLNIPTAYFNNIVRRLTFQDASGLTLVEKVLFCVTPMSVCRRSSLPVMNFEFPSVLIPIRVVLSIILC